MHWRPLLGIEKATLLDQCRANGWSFVEDPSNRAQHFARVRWRRMMPSLASEGLDAARLGRLAMRMARAEAALDACAAAVAEAVMRGEGDTLVLPYSAIAGEPEEIALRVVERGLGTLNAAQSRLERLERLMRSLDEAWASRQPLRRTLNGCRIELEATGTLTLRRESGLRRRGMRGRQACGSETEAVPLATPEAHHTLPSDAERPAQRMPHDALPMT